MIKLFLLVNLLSISILQAKEYKVEPLANSTQSSSTFPMTAAHSLKK